MTDEELQQLDNDELFWKIVLEARESMNKSQKPLFQCYKEYLRRFGE